MDLHRGTEDTEIDVLGHRSILDNLIWLLNQHIRPNTLAKITALTAYLPDDAVEYVRGSRVPDVMIVLRARLDAYQAADPDWASKPLVLVPDIAVEIVSPNDKYSEVSVKVKRYLEDGVKLVWVLEPETRQILVYTADGVTQLSGEMTLTGGDVLPGLAIALSDIFNKG
jgi:Uma2 family endonuclease